MKFPGSFVSLLIAGLVLAAIPLAIALTDALMSLDKLAVRSQHAISRSVSATRDARVLSEQLGGLERLARQQIVLEDSTGLEDYTIQRERMQATLARLNDFSTDDILRNAISEILRQEELVWTVLNRDMSRPIDPWAVGESFDQMSIQTNNVSRVIDTRISEETEALSTQTERAQRATFMRLTALLPITLILGIGLVTLVQRPVKKLADGIRRLGDGKADHPIRINGPRDLETIAEQLEWLRVRLSEVEAQKTRFLHHVSHELKTPLTAVYEGSQLLSDGVAGELNESQKEIAGILRDNVIRLRQLIENLLDYSNIRLQPAVLELQSVLLDDVFSELARDHRLVLTSKHLTMQTKGGELSVLADADKLRVILDNLISNAVKYAPSSSIIEIEAREDGSWVIIEVADSGPGVPAEAQQRVFEPFVQDLPPSGSSVKGTGLGLSIVKELIAAHGGDVTLIANQPVGARVRLRLPTHKDAVA